MQNKHKYRVTVYLGKENYQKYEEVAQLIGISISQYCRMVLDFGMQFADNALDLKEVAKNGNKQPTK